MIQVIDFVTSVNCSFTLGAFTKWDMFRGDNFSEEYGDVTTEDIKERCITEFMKAVADRGKVYFVDSHSQRKARAHSSIKVSVTLREEYYNVLNQYKTFWNIRETNTIADKVCELENTVGHSDSKSFWNSLESIDDTMKEIYTPPISEGRWMSHSQSLHLNEPLNEH